MQATDKQISYLLQLAGKVQGDTIAYLSQVRCISLTQREKKGGMTKAEASAHIEALLKMADK